MIGFEGFRMVDGTPIYLQIIDYLKRGVAAGTVANGDELPSRRVLSALLGVNPNTVQKAYRMLEEEGLLHSHSGAKSTMVLPEAAVQRVRSELLEQDARTVAAAMKQLGLTLPQAQELLARYWQD